MSSLPWQKVNDYMEKLGILLVVAVGISSIAVDRQVENDETYADAKFDIPYRGYITSPNITFFQYRLTIEMDVVRVRIKSNATRLDPLLVVIREERAVLSWQIPLVLENRYEYSEVSRTLCPINSTYSAYRHPGLKGDEITIERSSRDAQSAVINVEISTSAKTPLTYEVEAEIITEFFLELEKPETIAASPSHPQYFRFSMPKSVSRVLIQISSDSDICMVVSVQPLDCPVFDLDTNVAFTGTYQTITQTGAISIARELISDFYVVFVVKPSDAVCTGTTMLAIMEPPGPLVKEVVPLMDRIKNSTIVIKPYITTEAYAIAVVVTIASFMGLWLFVMGISLIFHYRDLKNERYIEARETIIEASTIINHERSGLVSTTVTYGSLDATVSDDLTIPSRLQQSPTAIVSTPSPQNVGEDSSAESEDYDKLDDASMDKNVVRMKANICVSDLARKPHKWLSRKYSAYKWNLITISVFYLLPVVQLVVTYAIMVQDSGNQDLCFYNFLCSHPLGRINNFNSVFSNVGYVLLGILFLILTANRDVQHQRQLKECPILAKRYGIPKFFGLFYTLGIALCIEGFLSACYHMCPSYTNFQFDTAFMYMIACLGMLRIYQTRHPDIMSHSHNIFTLMAFVILLAVIGVVYGGLIFWIIFSVFFMVITFWVAIEFYYKGRWKIDRGTFTRLKTELSTSTKMNWFIPTFPGRMLFVTIVCSINVAIMVFGVIKRPKDFPSYLLLIFIANLLLYTLYYVAMKIKSRERILARPVVYIVLSLVVWAFAMYFYMADLTTWMESPAESRTHNRECLLLDFYDAHDIWHFLSAISLFFSFMILLTIDDDLIYTPQDQIAVF